ncbi:MAG: hypothetical protein DCC49_02810 [Acidobacteria bacterium]|nr:MAG: hypothetical protein DCC49_02810 [Acidobacteriota bacterium]
MGLAGLLAAAPFSVVSNLCQTNGAESTDIHGHEPTPSMAKALDTSGIAHRRASDNTPESDYGSEGWGFESLRARSVMSRAERTPVECYLTRSPRVLALAFSISPSQSSLQRICFDPLMRGIVIS